MEHQRLLMKVMRDFAMADPENCEREWDVYLALRNRKETVSVSSSSSTRSTSHVHHRAPAAAVTAPATTRATAPLRASSDAVSTPTTAATASTSTSTSNLTLAISSVASASSDIITKDDLSPGARRCYDYLVGATTSLEDVHDAVDIGVAALAVSAPTTCSAECPSHDASVYAATHISSATPNSSTTTYDIIPELAACVVSDEGLTVDAASVSALPLTACLTDCLGSDCGTSFLAPPEDSPIAVSALFIGPAVGDLLDGGNHLTLYQPWPPPKLEMVDFHIKEAARGWIHRLEIVDRIEMHPLGELVSSPSPFTDNRTSSPCASWFLDDLMWKLPRWWSYVQYVQPTNAILDVSSWPWITSEHAKVEFQFSYPLILVNCQFASARVYQLQLQCILCQSEWESRSTAYSASYENFQWTIAWSLGYHFSLSILQTRSACVILLVQQKCPGTACLFFHGSYLHGMGEHLESSLLLGFHCQSSSEYFDSPCVVKREQTINSLAHRYQEGFLVVIFITHNDLALFIGWESRNMGCSTWTKENVLTQLLEVCNMLSRLTSTCFPAELIVFEHWLIPWDPGDVLVQHLLNQTRPRVPIPDSRAVDMSFPYVRVLEQEFHASWNPGGCNHRLFDDSSGHNLMENFASLSITCDLHYSNSVVYSLLAARYWVQCMRCLQLDIASPSKCVSNFRLKPPWSHFAPTISTSEFMSNMRFVSKSLHVISISFELHLLGIAGWYMFSARFRPPEAYFILIDIKHGNNKDMSSGSYPLSSVNHVQFSSHCSFIFRLYICSCHAISVRLSTSAIMPAGKFCLLLGLYSSCDQFVTGIATHLGSQIFELQIPWYIAWLLVKPSCAHLNFGGNGGLIMHFTVKTMGLQPTKVLCCSLLIQWPGVLISARASFYATLQNATQNLVADIGG